MDFDLTDEQQAIAELAAKLLGDKSTPEALRALEAAEGPDDLRFDRDLWAAMADAGLLGVAIPAEHGGAGLGMIELCLLLEEVGRRTAAVPALAALAFGGLPVARFGSPEQRAGILPGLAAGTVLVTAALVEPLGDLLHPTTSARPDGDAWVLDGTRTNVAAGMLADTVLVPATTPDDRTGIFVVPVDVGGLTRERQDTTTGTPDAQLTLDSVRVGADAPLGPVDAAGTVLRWTVEHATVATSAVMAGLAAEAVRMTGEYTTTREQFGRPVATFQAVGQRAADAYVDAQAIGLTMLQAAWRLDAGLPADREVATAKYWAAAGGQRVVHAAQHLHGGIGVDRDYPLHRYFLLAKQLELTLGGATRQLVHLGRLLAEP
ncbi:MAG TPA: acyl-CoA dehydrogenase family protein [Acidimicrobiales bacterium]|nr:acyl-CoA dehydrogenase family protein [Acidimicrobiales bacterium]